MQFDKMGNPAGKTLMLLPGTACDYQTNFGSVLDRLGEKYRLICVNYDGFDGGDAVFSDMITVTEKIEAYIKEKHGGRLDGAQRARPRGKARRRADHPHLYEQG